MLFNVSAGSLGQPLVSLTEKDDLQVFQIRNHKSTRLFLTITYQVSMFESTTCGITLLLLVLY
jgi:hypothetical protein